MGALGKLTFTRLILGAKDARNSASDVASLRYVPFLEAQADHELVDDIRRFFATPLELTVNCCPMKRTTLYSPASISGVPKNTHTQGGTAPRHDKADRLPNISLSGDARRLEIPRSSLNSISNIAAIIPVNLTGPSM